jgi:hypothetical protein
MSLSNALRDKLHLPGVKSGPVEVETDEGSAQVDLVEGDGIGVRVNRVRVNVVGNASVGKQAEKICETVRCLGGRLVPVEVEPRLQGGILRSDPRDMRRREYFEVGLDSSGATVERYRADPECGRDRQPFALTHDQLDELVDDLARALRGDDD